MLHNIVAVKVLCMQPTNVVAVQVLRMQPLNIFAVQYLVAHVPPTCSANKRFAFAEIHAVKSEHSFPCVTAVKVVDVGLLNCGVLPLM